MNDFKLKTELFFGSRALERLEQMPYRDIFIITDGFLESSGMVVKMAQHLPAGARYQTYSNVKPDPSQELVDEGVAAVEAARPDMVIAFGGGSCIDAAKAVLYTCCGRGMASHISWPFPQRPAPAPRSPTSRSSRAARTRLF